jgi:hypothetical protein
LLLIPNCFRFGARELFLVYYSFSIIAYITDLLLIAFDLLPIASDEDAMA